MFVYRTFASNIFTPASAMTPLALCMKTGAPDGGAREKNRLARCRRALAFSFLYPPVAQGVIEAARRTRVGVPVAEGANRSVPLIRVRMNEGVPG